MKRILLILDGTEQLEPAFTEVQHLCDPNDKLTILAVAEKPPAEVLRMAPRLRPETYAGSIAAQAPDVPILESEEETETRVAGDLRDRLDEKLTRMPHDGLDIWTQAIVRDQPAEAVAEYARASRFAEFAVPKKSLKRLQDLLTNDGTNVLDGSIAPVILLPG